MTPPPQDDLLVRFSKEVDLPAYLGQRGYEVVADARNAAYIAMAHRTSGQILLVAREAEGRAWTYKSAIDPRDRGSVADYLERHERLSKPAALERVVACLDPRRRDVPEAERYRAYLHDKPRALVEAESRHALAVRERSEALKALARVGIRTSAMPEWRVGGLEGGAVDKIFSEPAEIWASRYKPTDKKLIIAERPIDAISYGQARGERDACYLAIGGGLTPTRRTQIAHLLADLPAGISVVIACGRDRAGRQLATEVQSLAPQIKMERAQPEFGARWNDQVQLEDRHARSLRRAGVGLER
jgi:Toprim-like